MAITGAARRAGIVTLIVTGSFTGVPAAPVLDADSLQPPSVSSGQEPRLDLLAIDGRRIENDDAGFKLAESGPKQRVWTSPSGNTEALGESAESVREPGSFALLGLGLLALLLLGRAGKRR